MRPRSSSRSPMTGLERDHTSVQSTSPASGSAPRSQTGRSTTFRTKEVIDPIGGAVTLARLAAPRAPAHAFHNRSQPRPRDLPLNSVRRCSAVARSVFWAVVPSRVAIDVPEIPGFTRLDQLAATSATDGAGSNERRELLAPLPVKMPIAPRLRRRPNPARSRSFQLNPLPSLKSGRENDCAVPH
jgi:hypothetical protein